MAKFTVTLSEVVSYTVEVECDKREEAGDAAREMWCASEKPYEDFAGSSDGMTVDQITEGAS